MSPLIPATANESVCPRRTSWAAAPRSATPGAQVVLADDNGSNDNLWRFL
ncbi:hypothetical protein [Nonomuraea sp. NPDC049480]